MVAKRLIPAWAGKTIHASTRPRALAAHPRVGGENSRPLLYRFSDNGSSPRGRGKLNKDNQTTLESRLIPAWAGKTLARLVKCVPVKAHPRVGGENLTPAGRLVIDGGSSPRGRGKPALSMSFRIPIGLIPAWAGKTRAHNNTHTEDKAHPRVGGENLLPGYEALKSYGSSPRGRGKLNKDKQIIIKSRLIPAWAGKTPSPGIPCCGSWAHPRVGGENRSCPVGGVGPCGSSPRGRGKPGSRRNARSGHGLIPAWAGKTSIASFSMKATPAHPRVGGENSRPGRNDYYGHGSSPRGRGKLVAAIRDEWGDRLIPAWAGKTCIGHCAIDCHWAHPRVGGENPHPLADARARVGSSPRGRGKRTCAGLAAASSGLIPAWAGKTMPVSVPRLLRTAHPRVGGENFCIEDVILNDTGSSPRGRGKRRVLPRRATRPGLIPAWAGKTSAPAYCRGQGKAHPRVGGENYYRDVHAFVDEGSSPRGRGKHFLTCAFIERIGQILETLELAVSSESYTLSAAYATDAPQDQARNTALVLPSSRAAS